MQTSITHQAAQHLARAWALLDRAELLARKAVQDVAGPSLWLLAANSIERARDSLEAIHPDSAHPVGVGVSFGGECQDLVWAADRELAAIPRGHEPAGFLMTLVHLAAAEHEVGGRVGS